MNKLLIAAAVSALAIGTPAAAQYVNANAGGGVGISNRIANLEARLDAGVRAGTIEADEAADLRADLRALRRLERRYSRNGLTVQERQELQARLREIRQEIRLAGGGNARGYYDQYGNWVADDDAYDGRGGPYEEVQCENRGGLGGIFDNVFGRDDDDCDATLRVGQRVTGSLYAVPYQYRNRFRDGNGVYYRSDGRVVYQIDARTHTVLRIYDID